MTRTALAVTCAERQVPGLPEHLADVRTWVAALLPPACPRTADVLLVASELATNAVLHSASGLVGGAYRIRLVVTGGAVEVTVVDQGPATVPAQRPAGEGGYGLSLIAELADAYEARTSEAGRCAWCRIDLAGGAA
ncbi:hypothetical protein GCM10010466_65490 [Planomonospora alba]|uniref:Histidine kinase/HSP90-like ATPase domain-containing protein n=1 Tax=Planomonospora alba TaxID=161354 RepID=A0ABP6P3P6_9ACTN